MAPGAKNMRDVAVWNSEGRNASKIIFEGRVEGQESKTGGMGAPTNAMSMTGYGAHRTVSLRVLRAYRGQLEPKVLVRTAHNEAACGFDFENGKDYLVYADGGKDGDLFTSICTGTELLERSEPALRYLRGEGPTADDLMDLQSYHQKLAPTWTGKACGRVTKPDGSPLDKAIIGMTQLRNDSFFPKRASDPDLSKADGSFCVPFISPGRYVLTAEKRDRDAYSRWMGYYPGVGQRSRAVPIEIKAGSILSNLDFAVRMEPVFTVSFKIVTHDGSPLPSQRLMISIDSPYEDDLAYHLVQGRKDQDGYYTVGYVPPGKYLVRTLVRPDFPSRDVLPELAKWRMAEQEVEIRGHAEIVLTLKPAN